MQMKLAYQIAKTQIGVVETTGANATPKIIEYHQATSVQADSDEVPWCSAFVNWCYIVAGLILNPVQMRKLLTGKYSEGDIALFMASAKKLAPKFMASYDLSAATGVKVRLPTRAGNARSWQNFGQESANPEEGDIVVLWRESAKSWKGHVGFLVKKGLTYVDLLGGNQGNKVTTASYSRTRVLNYRKD